MDDKLKSNVGNDKPNTKKRNSKKYKQSATLTREKQTKHRDSSNNNNKNCSSPKKRIEILVPANEKKNVVLVDGTLQQELIIYFN
mmetsp:Transcript_10970/g.15691  ORF Transcript_10970/g.15691 Transcript_10970/m.15691 type:complete len:85 (+) Transcript_10970:341-595(+)